MFKRRALAVLILVAAMTASVGAAVTVPETAKAATCTQWQLRSDTIIRQSNGWRVWLQYQGGWNWTAKASSDGFRSYMGGRGTFSPRTGSTVSFVLTWNNGSAGVYDGFIDRYGFVSGSTHDRWNSSSRAGWHMDDYAYCIW